MMGKLFVLTLALLPIFSLSSFSASAAPMLRIDPGTLNYQCRGPRVSGMVKIINHGNQNGSYWPYYSTQTKFLVNGRPYRWDIQMAAVRPWHQSVFLAPKGTWKPDESRLIYTLGGRQENFNGWSAVFHVQVTNRNWKNLKGYLGFQDEERAEVGAAEADTYWFSCTQVL